MLEAGAHTAIRHVVQGSRRFSVAVITGGKRLEIYPQLTVPSGQDYHTASLIAPVDTLQIAPSA